MSTKFLACLILSSVAFVGCSDPTPSEVPANVKSVIKTEPTPEKSAAGKPATTTKAAVD